MTSISNNFTATGNGTSFTLSPGDTATCTVTGTFVATLVLERTLNGGQTWEIQRTTTTTLASTTIRESGTYRWRCTSFASGTATAKLADVNDTVGQVFTNPMVNSAGAPVFEVLENGIQAPNVPRIVVLADAATVTPNGDTTDIARLTPTQDFTLANMAGTPYDGQVVQLDVISTGVKNITFDTEYEATAIALPTVTGAAAVRQSFLWQYVAATAKRRLLAYNAGA